LLSLSRNGQDATAQNRSEADDSPHRHPPNCAEKEKGWNLYLPALQWQKTTFTGYDAQEDHSASHDSRTDKGQSASAGILADTVSRRTFEHWRQM
jgi:hypothetical protein